ncbi:hypothetical protein [Hymenobacter chitinivorans]|uniref:Uncharacterized protein n=1 Tax=Hymenobacter chitinivorans DSM 11115 TaxID=1121954 RepID=A0A2M9BQS8_9BACT|nr:hypothetical protein [Hymenobacter chitinivorans]PJJ60295.1 hypothetical protein CLV45_1720 [Hymenobacter chitinivorans DSM 11115]
MRFLYLPYIYLALLSSCQGIRPVGDTEFTDKQRERRFRPNSAKLAVLRRAVNNQLPEAYRDNPTLLKRYHYWPVVVDHHFRGLWHFDNSSHQGPILVLNGKYNARVIPMLLDKGPTLDSLQVALKKYSLAEINQEVRTGITIEVESYYRK